MTEAEVIKCINNKKMQPNFLVIKYNDNNRSTKVLKEQTGTVDAAGERTEANKTGLVMKDLTIGHTAL